MNKCFSQTLELPTLNRERMSWIYRYYLGRGSFKLFFSYSLHIMKLIFADIIKTYISQKSHNDVNFKFKYNSKVQVMPETKSNKTVIFCK